MTVLICVDTSKQVMASLTRPANPADIEKTCRAYAESFYRIVLTRRAASGAVLIRTTVLPDQDTWRPCNISHVARVFSQVE